jgi:hypothetical protein
MTCTASLVLGSLVSSLAYMTPQAGFAQSTTITVRYVDELTNLRGALRTASMQVSATLHPGNRVTEGLSWTNARGQGSARADAPLGRTDAHSRVAVTWRVLGPEQLQRVREFENQVEVMTIAVEGQSCRASVSHRLKPGHDLFMRYGGRPFPVYFRDVRSKDVQCSIRSGT